ncbi:MAG: hypothetical protein HYX61_03160 [Gammaproteobacteria bacterium]|nr:hypothetical protein [Gammaproteobacteria bacterium]
MLGSIYVQPRSPEDLRNLERFIANVISKQDELVRMESDQDRIAAIAGWAAGYDVTISDEQILTLLNQPLNQNVEDIEGLLLANEGTVLHPAAKLALQTSLMLAAAYWTPELFAFYTSKEIIKKLLTPAIGTSGVNLADGIVTMASLSYGYPNQLSLINSSLPASIHNLHAIFRIPSQIAANVAATKLLPHASAPVQALLSKTGRTLQEIADSEFVETAGDFFDLMHGTSGDDERDAYLLERYKGTLATKTFDDIGSDIGSGLRWLYNCLPNRRISEARTTASQESIELVSSSSAKKSL